MIDYNAFANQGGWVSGNIISDFNLVNNHFSVSNNLSIIDELRSSVVSKNNKKDKTKLAPVK